MKISSSQTWKIYYQIKRYGIAPFGEYMTNKWKMNEWLSKLTKEQASDIIGKLELSNAEEATLFLKGVNYPF